MMRSQTIATCKCGWQGALDELALAHFELACPECGGRDWDTAKLPDEDALRLMGEAFKAMVMATQGQRIHKAQALQEKWRA